MTSISSLQVVKVDPQGDDALALLREAAIEARILYAELHGPDDPWPTNAATPPRGIYLIAYLDGQPVGMGAHRPLDHHATEIRRMFTRVQARRAGVARAILRALQVHAIEEGFTELKLETGFKQRPAIALYESFGFVRTPSFGPYVHDPTSVCFAKRISGGEG